MWLKAYFIIWNISSLLISKNKRGPPADMKDKAPVTLGSGTGSKCQRAASSWRGSSKEAFGEKNAFRAPGVPFHIWATPVVDHNRCTAGLRGETKKKGQNCAEQTLQKCFDYCSAQPRRASRILISSFFFKSRVQPFDPPFHWPRASLTNHVINSFICHLRVGHDGSPGAAYLSLCGKTPGAVLSIYPIMKYPHTAN